MRKSTVTCDLEGVIETFNEGAESIFGYSAEEVVGKKRVSLFSPGQIVLQNVEGWLKEAREQKEYSGKTVFVRKDGSTFPARIRITPTYRNGEMVGYCGVTEPLENEMVEVPIRWSTKLITGLVITRAPFLSAALMPLFIGGAFAATMLGDAPFPTVNFLLTVLGVALLHLASNVFNDYFDWKNGTDLANAKYFLKYSGGSRAIELGLISLQGTFKLAVALLSISVIIGLYLTLFVGTGVLVLGSVGALLGYAYTAPPLRLVARKGLGELAISLAFGPLITAGVGYVVLGDYDPTWMTFLIGVPVGLLTTNILVINQVPDAESDATTGKNHLVVVLGEKNTPWLYGGIVALATAVHAWLALNGNAAGPLWWMPFGILVAYGVYIIRYMVRFIDKRELVHANIQTIILNVVYGTVFAGIITFF